jgi:hypothetical protein
VEERLFHVAANLVEDFVLELGFEAHALGDLGQDIVDGHDRPSRNCILRLKAVHSCMPSVSFLRPSAVGA